MTRTGYRVKQTTTSTGTGLYNLGSTPYGFQSFAAGIGAGDVYYCCENVDENAGTGDWEIGIGILNVGTTDQISRSTILASSNGGSAVNWGSGTKRIFSSHPSDRFLIVDNNLSEVNAVVARSNLGVGSGGGDSPAAESTPIAATGHGFSETDTQFPHALHFNGSIWQNAEADRDRPCVAVLTSVVDDDTIRVMRSGVITATGHGRTLGQHYLAAQPGQTSTVDPAISSPEHLSQKILVAVDANTLLIGVESARG